MHFAEEAFTFSVWEMINVLKNQGYTEDFNNTHCAEEFLKDPHDFKIDKTFRFDILSDPEDQSVLYALSSKTKDIKGVLLNGYGIYSDPVATKLLDIIDPESDYNKELSYPKLESESLEPTHDSDSSYKN